MRIAWIPAFLLIAAVATGLGLASGCGTVNSGAKVTLSGSSTVAPLMGEIGRAFEKAYPHVRVDVQSGGSSRGIKDASSGVIDLGMSSRDLKSNELSGVSTKVIAWDGVAFVLNANNPVSNLTRDNLIDIFTGRINNWKSLGGDDAKIVVANRAEGRSELDLIKHYLEIKSSEIAADIVDGETQQSIKTITNNIYAIGYTSMGAARYAADDGEPIKLLPLDGVPPTANSIQSGLYKLARPLVLIIPDSMENQWAKSLVAFAESPVADTYSVRLGFVPPIREAD